MPLQNAHASHADLSDLAHAHTTKDSLFHDLERHKQLRSKEMLVAWEEIALALGMKESILESDDRWAKFTQLSRTRALDAFSVVDESKRHDPGHPRRWNTEGGQDVDDLASIHLAASYFNRTKVHADEDRTSVPSLPNNISTEGTAPHFIQGLPKRYRSRARMPNSVFETPTVKQ